MMRNETRAGLTGQGSFIPVFLWFLWQIVWAFLRWVPRRALLESVDDGRSSKAEVQEYNTAEV